MQRNSNGKHKRKAVDGAGRLDIPYDTQDTHIHHHMHNKSFFK